LNKSDLSAKLAVFYDKIAKDSAFAERVRTEPVKALGECGIDLSGHEVSFDLKIDNEVVQHFVMPSFTNEGSISEEEMSSINAAKGKKKVYSSSVRTFPSCVSSIDASG
jgi:hypothetical protein